MQRFIRKCILLLVLAVPVHYGAILLIHQFIDIGFLENYRRFATPSQSSLILGTSISAQGLVPEMINATLKNVPFDGPIFNFSFGVHSSPYGEAYLTKVLQKLNRQTRNGIFILSVDPWSLSKEKANQNDSEAEFREVTRPLATNYTVTGNGHNFEFFLRSFPLKSFRNTILGMLFHLSPKAWGYITPTGWEKLTTEGFTPEHMTRMKEKLLAKWEKRSLINDISMKRIEALAKMVRVLGQYGQVYLVRMPVSVEQLDIEHRYCPDFNDRMVNLSTMTGVKYWDFTPLNNRYLFYDGYHLWKASSREFSLVVAQKIKAQYNTAPARSITSK